MKIKETMIVFVMMWTKHVIISCLYPLWRSDPQDQVSIWYFWYWGPGLQEQKVEMEIRSPGPGPHLVFLVLRTRSPEAKGGDGDQVSSLEYWRMGTRYILSPVTENQVWGSGLHLQIISCKDKIFLTKYILSPVPKNQLWRSGLHNRIIYCGDKIFFD